MAIFGQAASGPTMTHLKRELMHAIWELLLDDEFMHAYEHGIVLKCADGVIRRIYPRFFTYAADYPEKYMIFQFCNELLTIFYQSPTRNYPLPCKPPLSSMFYPEKSDKRLWQSC
jgi:hypothetical protein